MADNVVVIDTELKIDNLKKNVKEIEKELKALEVEKKKLDSYFASYKEIGVKPHESDLKAYDDLNAKISNLSMESADAKNQINSLKQEEKDAAIAIKNAEKASKQAATSIKKIGDSAKKSSNGFKFGLKSILKYAFGIRSVFVLINRLRNALVDGIKNLAQFRDGVNPVNTAISNLKSALTQLKNSFATAFAPILTAVEPILTKLINIISRVVTYIGMFIAALTGQKTFTKAIGVQENYAASLDKTAKSAKKASNQLSKLDELNVINSQEEDSSGGALGGISPNKMFEEIKIPEEVIEWAERLKGLLAVIGGILLGWSIFKLLSQFGTLGYILGAIIGTVLAIYSYFKMWQDGVDWKGIVGYIAGITLAVLSLFALFGPVAAGIALIVGGIAGLVLAIKDMITNGVNAQNITLAIASAIMVVVGVFLVFGSTAAIVVGVIMLVVGAIAALVKAGGTGKEVLENLKKAFSALGSFVKKIFAGDIKGAFNDLKTAAKSFGNAFIAIAEGIANGFVKMANIVIEAINGMLPEKIPDWVPVVGGGSFPKIPTISKTFSLPRLASGTVVPRQSREFAAILGDNNRETEVVSPLSTMKQAMIEALRESGIGNNSGTIIVPVNIDGREVFRVVQRQSLAYTQTTGRPAFN